MKKTIAVLLSLIPWNNALLAQDNRGVIDSSLLPGQHAHYMPEYTFDKPVGSEAWQTQKRGLHVAFGSSDKSYFRTEVPVLSEQNSWEATGWKGERLNTQLLAWSPDSIQQVRLVPSDLRNAAGKVISSKNIRLQLVRYVISNYPYGAKDAVCGQTPYKNGYLMPDRLETFDRFDLPGKTARPVWVSLDVPASAEAGIYSGAITAIAGGNSIVLPIKIKVQQQVLPSPHNWTYRLDLWQNPWVVAWKNHLTPWSEAHKTLLKQHLKLYADAGGKYITTYAVHSPWADNSYMIEGGMIEWIKQKNGRWKFDYNIFDTYVQLAMEAGIDKAITIYTPIPWGNRFRYMDEATGDYVYASWPPASPQFMENWNHFLTDLKMHLQQKGWFEKTYLGINENEMQQTLEAIKVIKKHSPAWRITYAGDWHPELDTLLDDYSFLYGKEPNAQQLQQRKERGATSTFYVCCNPAKPNNFVFSPPIEGRWISWYAYAFGYHGFLRWAYDAWPEDPVRDARFGSWPAGDCFMVYPGGGSSIRFETMREGIVDFEKIQILKKLAAQSDDRRVKDLWEAFQQHVKVFAVERDFEEGKITGDVEKGKGMIEELSDVLGRE